jgi:hypothetical protein
MKVFVTLVLGIAVGAALVWYLNGNFNRSSVESTRDKVVAEGREARDATQDKLHSLNLRADDIKDELARTGRVIRDKTREAGHAIADATADARTTTAIKAKLVADPELSALSISVNTTEGVVTLSGTVSSEEKIAKAMMLALDTDNVRQVISTLQVKAA